MSVDKFDVCVVGGGMVGATLAVGLLRQGYKVAIAEREMPKAFAQTQSPDLRISAINIASVDMLSALGVWQHAAAMRVHPYSRLQVWDDPKHTTTFAADDINEPLLGYFVENRILQLAAHAAITEQSEAAWFSGVTVSKLSTASPCEVTFSDGKAITADWVIGADGSRSLVRELAGIGIQGWQYAQQALGIQIKTTAQTDTTWQQFTPTGPLAYLPMFGGYASLVWYHTGAEIKRLSALSDTALKQQISEHFPDKLGEFEVTARGAFPLFRQHANQYVKGAVVLAGDAAHTINPLAGQGVNLGFKDVAALLKQTATLSGISDKPASESAMKRYEKQRRNDNLLMMTAMDAFYFGFSNDFTPLKVIRNLGLKLADKAGPAKRKVLKYAMGG